MQVLVLSGGRSSEREISIISARWVSRQLRAIGHGVTEVLIGPNGGWALTGSDVPLSFEAKSVPWKLLSNGEPVRFDVVFPVLHGAYGEDGTVQGFCALAGWPCSGVPVLGSAVAMEKHTMKQLASRESIPVVPWVFLSEDREVSLESMRHKIEQLGYPLFVKPSRQGSSYGVFLVSSSEELEKAVKAASAYDPLVLIEKALDSPREIEVSVVGNGSTVFSSVPGEVVPGNGWYDFSAKYESKESELKIPAELPASRSEDLRMMAERVFKLLGGRGFARVDFFVEEGKVWLNEVNTIPGFTGISMFPKLWEATGMGTDKLFNFILDEAFSRREYGVEDE